MKLKDFFTDPSAEELRQRQLDDARRKLAEYEEAVEYATAMRDMLKARIIRLETGK